MNSFKTVGVGLGRPVIKLNVLFEGGASPAPTDNQFNSITQTKNLLN